MPLSTVARTMISQNRRVRTVVGVMAVLLVSTLFGHLHNARGQQTTTACADALEAAEESYRNRNYQDAITLGNQCTDPEAVGDSTAIRAYRVMTLSFLRQGALVQAHSTVENILALKPTYATDPVADPPSYTLWVSLIRQREELNPAAPPTTQAQEPDAGGEFFLKVLGLGLADYTGDYPGDIVSHPFDMQGLSPPSGFPYVFSFELGYFVSPKFAVALGFQAGNYPKIGLAGSYNWDSDRYTPQLLARYLFGDPEGTFTPYIDGGYNVTFGGGSSTSTGSGPSFGGGLDVALTRSTSMYVESRFNLTFPDRAIDGQDNLEKGSITGPFDSVNQLIGLGIRVNLGKLSEDPSN